MTSYYHKLDPFLIQFSSDFGIRWYSMAYIMAAVLAYYIGLYLIQKKRLLIPKDQLTDIVTYGAMGAVLGGRLGYCLFYNPELFYTYDGSFPFWSVLKIHQGGMSSHGGILGLLITQYLYHRQKHVSFYSLLDLSAVAGSIGLFLGRIANFINGELYGRIAGTGTRFTVKFPTELYLWASEPELYKNKLYALKDILATLRSMFPSRIRIPSVQEWDIWVSKASQGDVIYESYISYVSSLIQKVSDKAEIQAILEPLLFSRYPSQLYQSFFGGLMPFLIICLLWLKVKKPGVISLAWIVSYLFFRIITEFFRQPDSHIGFQLFDLTRGQWLSMFLYIIVIIYGYCVYKNTTKSYL